MIVPMTLQEIPEARTWMVTDRGLQYMVTRLPVGEDRSPEWECSCIDPDWGGDCPHILLVRRAVGEENED